jgi:NAD(P)-dependent dehydrogenase (short-subunit alcohol dehydrogenase family)
VLLDCYAQEVANISSVRVAIVNPGATRTAMRARAYPGEDPIGEAPEVVGEAIRTAGRRFRKPHRVAVN